MAKNEKNGGNAKINLRIFHHFSYSFSPNLSLCSLCLRAFVFNLQFHLRNHHSTTTFNSLHPTQPNELTWHLLNFIAYFVFSINIY